MNFGSRDKPRNAFHDFAEGTIPVTVLVSDLAILSSQRFNALRNRLIAFGQSFDPLIDGHILAVSIAPPRSQTTSRPAKSQPTAIHPRRSPPE